MAKIVFQLTATFDPEAAADHELSGRQAHDYPLVREPSEYTWDDLRGAYEHEILTELEVTDFTELEP